jgi:hypothetical protein
MTELGGQIVVLTKKKNDEHLRVLIGDEGRKRQHTRNDVYQTSVGFVFMNKKISRLNQGNK